MEYEKLIRQMSLEDKIALCSGADSWYTKAFDKYGIPSVMMSDGPHGLRKQENGNEAMDVNHSKPATCYPCACSTGSSWDRALLKDIGRAIAKEALHEGISIVLGPGINIKRNPLCGRNFEYFSEDPFLSGELGAAFIQGVEELGVGTSLKHFAANNQEDKRLSSDSIVDERTLKEIYLSGFETAVKKGKPATVMCAYNKINGIHCSDNPYLLNETLRKEWGFDGVVISDWGAMNDRIAAFKAGTDLEMPGGMNYFDSDVLAAVRSGKISEDKIDESVDRILKLLFKYHKIREKEYTFDQKAHHELARRASANSAVLLKNEECLLPLHPSQKVAVVGHFAQNMRYQGSGSSHINPFEMPHLLKALDRGSYAYHYYEGCKADGSTTDSLINEAVAGAKACDCAVVCAGLTEEYESEGFDRENLNMPEGHIRMIREVAKANPHTVVVLFAGSVSVMPWLDDVKSVLHMFLPGQAGGEAVVDLLYGRANPSGKLSETYPLAYEDVPSAGFYENGGIQAQYREGIFVGYRFYDKAKKSVCFPFGFGLSYTTFQYDDLMVRQDGTEIILEVTVKNTGNRAGAEIVQLYVSDRQVGVQRPEKELKGFEKVFLEAGEAKNVQFTLDQRAFAYYDIHLKSWQVQKGFYAIQAGASSRDIRLSQTLHLEGTMIPAAPESKGTWYEHLRGKPLQADLETILGREIKKPEPVKRGSYTMDQSVMEMQDSWIMRLMVKIIERIHGKTYGGVDYTNPTFRMVMIGSTHNPLKSLSMSSGGMLKRHLAEGLVHLANGRILKGLILIIKG